MEELIEKLKKEYEIYDVIKQREDFYVFSVEKNKLHSLLYHLKNIENFKHLTMIAYIDWIEENKFQLSYVLWNYRTKRQVSVRVFLNRDNPHFKTIMHLWPQAEVYEREIREMMGITFEGNPTQFEDFALEDWDNIPPMRKDFDTYKYAMEKFGERPGRKSYEPRDVIAERYDEWRRK